MFCQECGKDMGEGASFCANCGNKVGSDQIKVASTTYNVSSTVSTKNKTTAGILGILLGGLGIHKFYLGYTAQGLIPLLANTVGLLITWPMLFIPNYLIGIIGLIEGILYLTKSDEEFEQTYVKHKKPWF